MIRRLQDSTLSLQPESQDLEDAQSILSAGASVTFTMDPILLRTAVYRKALTKVR